MTQTEPTLASRVTGEFGHSPVTFVASVLALLDVLYRVYELIRGQIEGPPIALPKVAAPLAPSAAQAAFYLMLFIFLALLAQNLISFVWYKFVVWLSNLPMLALVPLTFLLCGTVSLITNYNILTLSGNIAQMYQFDTKVATQTIFVIAAFLSALITFLLMMSLVQEYDNTHQTSVEQFGIANMILYMILMFSTAILLFPR